jgi:hypothetical protein
MSAEAGSITQAVAIGPALRARRWDHARALVGPDHRAGPLHGIADMEIDPKAKAVPDRASLAPGPRHPRRPGPFHLELTTPDHRGSRSASTAPSSASLAPTRESARDDRIQDGTPMSAGDVPRVGGRLSVASPIADAHGVDPAQQAV